MVKLISSRGDARDDKKTSHYLFIYNALFSESTPPIFSPLHSSSEVFSKQKQNRIEIYFVRYNNWRAIVDVDIAVTIYLSPMESSFTHLLVNTKFKDPRRTAVGK